MESTLVCWKCDACLAALSLPLARLDECKACGAELHVCRLCEFYDVTVAKHCREPIAEEVKDKERANFCDYFRPRPGAFSDSGQSAAELARRQLDALFGGAAPSARGEAKPSEGDLAKAKLEALFGKKSP